MDFVYSLIIALIGIAISVYVARKYGDVAGTKAAIEYEKEKDKKSHQIATYALINQVNVAKEVAKKQQTVHSGDIFAPITKMPVTSFETAFLNGKDSFMANHVVMKKDLDLISRYLSKAYCVNASVDIHIHNNQEPRPGDLGPYNTPRQLALTEIGTLSREIVEILDEIHKLLWISIEVDKMTTALKDKTG